MKLLTWWILTQKNQYQGSFGIGFKGVASLWQMEADNMYS